MALAAPEGVIGVPIPVLTDAAQMEQCLGASDLFLSFCQYGEGMEREHQGWSKLKGFYGTKETLLLRTEHMSWKPRELSSMLCIAIMSTSPRTSVILSMCAACCLALARTKVDPSICMLLMYGVKASELSRPVQFSSYLYWVCFI